MVGQATNWDQDHTDLFAQAVLDSINSGGSIPIPGKTFYCRGQIRILNGEAGVDPTKAYLYSVTQDAYTIYVPPGFSYDAQGHNDIKIVGTPQAGSNNGTRLVHGVLVQGDEIKLLSDLDNDDTWKGKFPAVNGYEVKWVQFPSDPLVWRWDSTDSNAAVGESGFATTSMANFPTATLNGVPLKFAESFRGKNAYDSEYRWQRAVNSGSQTQIKVASDLGQIDITDNKSTWALTFHSNDTEPALSRVSSFSTTNSGGTDYVLANLLQSPWTAPLEGSATAWDKNQRVTFVNAPQFLKYPDQMVINFTTKRLFFLTPTGQGTGGMSGEPISGVSAVDIGVDSGLEVSLPKGTYTGATPTANYDSALSLSLSTRKATVSNIVFSTGRTMMCRVQDSGGGARPSNTSKFVNCKFRNLGHNGISMLRCENWDIDSCVFQDGYRGHLKIDAGFDFRTRRYDNLGDILAGARLDKISSTDNMKVTGCTIQRGGLLWPRVAGITLDRFNIGTEITGCTFSDLSAKAVWMSGVKNTVHNNTFSDCLKDVSDDGCVYIGNSWLQIGNRIYANQFNHMKLRGRASQTLIANSLEDDVAGVMLDDYMCGTYVAENYFSDCRMGIMSNGGRYNIFYRNNFSQVTQPFGTIVPSNTTIGFRLWNTNVFKRSKPNQAYAELRTVMGLRPNIFNPNGYYYSTLMAQGAYNTFYLLVDPDQTVDDESSNDTARKKDLYSLVTRLNVVNGNPENINWYGGTNGDPFDSIELLASVEDVDDDWFFVALDTNPPLFPKHFMMQANSNQWRSVNTGNIIVWNEEDFDTLPSYFPLPGAVNRYINNNTPGEFQRQKNANKLDPYGYFSWYVPHQEGGD
jgi:hypothetical protein